MQAVEDQLHLADRRAPGRAAGCPMQVVHEKAAARTKSKDLEQQPNTHQHTQKGCSKLQ